MPSYRRLSLNFTTSPVRHVRVCVDIPAKCSDEHGNRATKSPCLSRTNDHEIRRGISSCVFRPSTSTTGRDATRRSARCPSRVSLTRDDGVRVCACPPFEGVRHYSVTLCTDSWFLFRRIPSLATTHVPRATGIAHRGGPRLQLSTIPSTHGDLFLVGTSSMTFYRARLSVATGIDIGRSAPKRRTRARQQRVERS